MPDIRFYFFKAIIGSKIQYMKTLYIVRHAKSSWEFPELSDEERPLLEKGVRRTAKIVKFLLEKNVILDLIISSYALMSLETAKLIGNGLGYPLERIRVTDDLYHAGSDDLLDHLFGIPDEINAVMIVGHNPGFSRFARDFDRNAPDWLPTSGVVAIEFDADKWNEILDANHDTIFIVYPGMLS